MAELRRLDLVSPFGAEKASYTWPLQHHDKNSKLDGSIEIIETIRWVFEDLPELREAMREELSVFTISGDMKDFHSMKTLCDKYNSALIRVLEARGSNTPLPGKRPSVGLLKHIIQKSYNQAVSDPEKLNEYKSWSPEVYGETSFEFISQMLDNCNLKPDDVFIDLGSGVGQVVLQVAASVSGGLAKCVGIEKADVPYDYSKDLDYHFKFWMAWFGKSCSKYELVKGDFFDEKFRSLINSASFIFVNNFAFGPRVDHSLKKRFEDLKDGARIVSSKPFSPLNFRISDRNLNDIGTMMDVRELQPIKESVSWTHNSVSYYCHTINRKKLEEYFNNVKQSRSKNNSDSESNHHNHPHRNHKSSRACHSSSSSSSTSSSVSSLNLNHSNSNHHKVGGEANSLLHRCSPSVRDSASDSNSNDSTSINTANDHNIKRNDHHITNDHNHNHNSSNHHLHHHPISSTQSYNSLSSPVNNSSFICGKVNSSSGKTASGKSPGAMSGKKAPTTYDQDGQIIFGPTTRKAWKEFVESTSTPGTSGQVIGTSEKESKSGQVTGTLEKESKSRVKENSTKKTSKSPVSKKKKKEQSGKKSNPKSKGKEGESDEEEEHDSSSISSSGSSTSASSDSGSSESESDEEVSSSNENVDENIKKTSGKSGGLNSGKSGTLSSSKSGTLGSGKSGTLKKVSSDSKVKSGGSSLVSKRSPAKGSEAGRNKPGRGRPRKYAPGVSAVVKRAACTAAGKKSAGSSSAGSSSAGSSSATSRPNKKSKGETGSVRPRGRPPKSPKKCSSDPDQETSLDVFHQQTLKTISSTMGKRSSPAPGTFEDKIDTSLNSPSYLSHLPSAIIKDSSLLSMEHVLDQLLGQQRRQLSAFIAYMQTPEYRIELSKEIEEEKKKNQVLKLEVSAIEKSIRQLQASGVESLVKKLNEVGIKNVSTPQEVLLRAGEMIARNKMLLEQELTLTAQVKQQEAINQQIESIRIQMEGQNGGKKGSKGVNESKVRSASPASLTGRTSVKGGSKRQSTSSNSSAASSTSFDTSTTTPGFGTPGLPQSSMANIDKVSNSSFFGSWTRPSGTPSPVTFSSLSSSANASPIKSSTTPSGIFGSGSGSGHQTPSTGKNQSKGLTTSSGTTITPIVIPATTGTTGTGTGTTSTGTVSISNAKDHINSMIIAQLNTSGQSGHPNGPSGQSGHPNGASGHPNGASGHPNGASGVSTPSFPGQQSHHPSGKHVPPVSSKGGKGSGGKEGKVKKEPKKRGPKSKDTKTHLVPKEKLHQLLSQQPLVKPDSPKVPLLSRSRKASLPSESSMNYRNRKSSTSESTMNYGTGMNTTPHTNDVAYSKNCLQDNREQRTVSKMKDEKHPYTNESSPRNPVSSSLTSTSVKSSPHPGTSPGTSDNPGGEVKERLTLTLVLNRKNDSASVKSSSKSASNNTSPDKSPVKSPEYSVGSVPSLHEDREQGTLKSGKYSVGSVHEDREQGTLKSGKYSVGSVHEDREQGTLRSGTKRKGVICSPERSGGKKTRCKSSSNLVIDESSQSPASTTSSGGEKKITIKFGTSTSRTESSLITTDPTLTTAPSNLSLSHGPTSTNGPSSGGTSSGNGPNTPLSNPGTSTGHHYNSIIHPVSQSPTVSASSQHPLSSATSSTTSSSTITTKSSGSYRKWKKEMDNSFDKSLANASHASNDSQSSTNSSSQFGTSGTGGGGGGGGGTGTTTGSMTVSGHGSSIPGGINNSDGHSTTSSTRPNSGSSIESLMSMDSNSAVNDPLDSSANSSRDNVVNVNKYQLNYATVDEMRRQQQYQPNRHQQGGGSMYGSTEDVYQQFFNSAAAARASLSVPGTSGSSGRSGLPGPPFGLYTGMWAPSTGPPPGTGQPGYIRNVPMFPWKG